MKKIFYKICTLIGVTFLVFLADSCLKDDRFVDFSSVGNVVEFPDAAAGKATALDLADPTASEPDTVIVRLHQLGPNATGQDLVVSLGFSQGGIDTYNLDGSHVVGTALPTDAYSFPSTVTIKAGKDEFNNNNRSATIELLIYPNKVPQTAGVNYVLSLGIVSVSPQTTISGNYGAILFNFYHNTWDGHYTVTGTLVDIVVPTIGPDNPMDMNLVTINASKSYAFSNLYGVPYHPILSGASQSVYGNVAMIFTFDEATNDVIAVDNYYEDAPPRHRQLKIDDTGINHYDPATKVLQVKYILTQDDCGCDRTTFTETWTFVP